MINHGPMAHKFLLTDAKLFFPLCIWQIIYPVRQYYLWSTYFIPICLKKKLRISTSSKNNRSASMVSLSDCSRALGQTKNKKEMRGWEVDQHINTSHLLIVCAIWKLHIVDSSFKVSPWSNLWVVHIELK